jgi:hypothetical protein
MLSGNNMKLRPGNCNKKSEPPATDMVALHAVATLPASVEKRRKNLYASLETCPRSHYAERISVMFEHLEQHQACAQTVQNPKPHENE